ncbi:MAG: tetratricopeptide repeat protein [Burkholderiales bacterium]|nr:tetratricopeptide repeat protein [Burkholderiales bacterium]
MKTLRTLAAAALLAAAPAASGQGATDAERCSTTTGNPDLSIQYCTRAIESKQYSGAELARLHFSRGVDWMGKGERDRAIADYDAAVRLDPGYADAYYNRGIAWSGKGDSARAVADFDAAIKLDPKDAAPYAARADEWAMRGDYGRALADYELAVKLKPKDGASVYFGRGRVHFYSGEYARALPDFEQALKLQPNEYSALWIYLARRRAGGEEAEPLLDRDTRALRNGWPTPLVLLYLGRTNVDSVMAAATDKDPRRRLEQTCEAGFYVAQWHLLQADRARAAALLKEVAAGCPGDMLEHGAARAELRRLEK